MTTRTTASNIETGKPSNETETSAFLDIVNKALFFGDVDMNEWLAREGPETARIARVNGEVAGGLIIQPLGQWFGGRVVPMGGIRGVGVAPQFRATGVASAFMRASVLEMREMGLVISTLYPATQKVYRNAGYEKAGVKRRYRISTRAIDVRERGLEVRPITQNDHPALEELHRDRARNTAGNVERNRWLWDRIIDPPKWFKKVEGYIVLQDGNPEGYLINHNTPGFHPHKNTVELQDFVARTPQAARRLWTLLADHRSMAASVTFNGAPADPLMYHLDEQLFSIEDPMDWMVRINDVRGALEARGYPAGLTAELHLDVRDDIVIENNGCFILKVSDKRGTVASGGRGDLKIDIRGLAPLYTGHLTGEALLMTGYAQTRDDHSRHALEVASTIFAGPAPWMSDMF